MIDRYIGIDPGSTGGIVVLNEFCNVVEAIKMPDTPLDILDFLKGVCYMRSCSALIERVHGMPGMGGSSMFTFGENFGYLQMAMLALSIPFEDHTPQKWMKYYQMKRAKEESKTDWKNRLKQKAQQLFPDVKVTLAISDALLIAHYYYKISNI